MHLSVHVCLNFIPMPRYGLEHLLSVLGIYAFVSACVF